MARDSRRDRIVGIAGLLAGAVIVAASLDMLAVRTSAAPERQSGEPGFSVSVTAPSFVGGRAVDVVQRVFSDLGHMLFDGDSDTESRERENDAETVWR